MAAHQRAQWLVTDGRLRGGRGLGIPDGGCTTLSGSGQRQFPPLRSLGLQLRDTRRVGQIDLPPLLLEPAARLLTLGIEPGPELVFDAEDLCEGALLHGSQPARGPADPGPRQAPGPIQSSPYSPPHNPQ